MRFPHSFSKHVTNFPICPALGQTWGYVVGQDWQNPFLHGVYVLVGGQSINKYIDSMIPGSGRAVKKGKSGEGAGGWWERTWCFEECEALLWRRI